MQLKTIEKLIEEIEYLKRSHELLEKVYYRLSPYDHEINGKNAEGLPRKIAEHLHNFDDSE